MDKKQSRLRRAARARSKIRELGAHRLCVHRSPRHIYAQIISPDGNRVVASASTLDKEYRQSAEGHSGNISAAAVVGRIVAERARAAGVEQVSFDRSGFKYHGRVKALADAARESGLQF
ncbi:MAG: 50S ribosomal protein L18 [Thiohalocapsa sp.]|jgi:large subunit ribosomal protein L18|uniref:50S ribosomal protein L18 n=1 Tax=Thiohalocapsa sp. TaxID=2497641 RepID=UPI0025D83642|nr:50S ribosomal protein L18 [Thiohalocapsa sp.]